MPVWKPHGLLVFRSLTFSRVRIRSPPASGVVSLKKFATILRKKERKKMDTIAEKHVVCEYRGKNISGIVESSREIPGKGTLVVVRVYNGYKSFYMNEATNVRFLV